MMFFQVPNKKNSVIRGILTIATGVLLLTIPGMTLENVVRVIGILLMISGIVTFLASNSKKGISGSFLSFQGLFNIIIGAFFFFSPATVVKLFVFILGFLLFIMGVTQTMRAFSTITKSFWSWIYLFVGIMITMGGLYLISNPFKSAEAILSFIGALLLLFGFSELFMVWKMSNKPPVPQSGQVVDTTFEEVE